MCCSSTPEDSLPSAFLRGLARHFKTEYTETVALCFGYPKTPCLRAEDKLSSSVDEQQHNSVKSWFSIIALQFYHYRWAHDYYSIWFNLSAAFFISEIKAVVIKLKTHYFFLYHVMKY
jgi:hypothetical protein